MQNGFEGSSSGSTSFGKFGVASKRTTSTIRRHRGVASLLATLGMIVAALAAIPPATAALPPGVFELDGNAVAEVLKAGDDWSSAPNAFATTGIIAEPSASDVTYFTGGGSKDTNDISKWRYGGASVPDKDQITNAYAASYNTGSARSIYFGLDRFAVNGDGNVGFWFFKQNIVLGPSGTFVGTHTNGDIFIASAFTNGGAVSTIQIYEWMNGHLIGPLGGGGQCPLVGALPNVCARVNNAANAPALSPWSYVPKSGTPGTFPISAFFEGGINITAVLPGVQCFSAFLAETRSSQTTSAQLKDFAMGNFDTCRASIRIDPQDALNPVGTLHNLTLTVMKDSGSGFVAAPSVLVSASIVSGPGSFVGSNQCTTNATGQCVVTITSLVLGTTVVSASATVIIGSASYPVATDGTSFNSGPASKTWFRPRLATSTTTSPSPDSPIVLGESIHDVANVTDANGAPVPVGNVTFYLCDVGSGICASNGTQLGAPVALNASGLAQSIDVTPSQTGTYCFRGEYGGATLQLLEYSPSIDAGPNECFSVDPAPSSTATSPSSANLTLGESVNDDAVVDGLGEGFPDPTGEVTFYWCSLGVVPCESGGDQIGDPVALDENGLASSDPVTPLLAGAYCFRADYAGDGNYSASSDNRSNECFNVGKASSNTTTTPSNESIVLGDVILDGSVTSGLGGDYPVPTGNVTFYLCDLGVVPCASNGTQIGDPVALANGSASSDPIAPLEAGAYCFRADYSGDDNYNASSDGSLGECFGVDKAPSNTTTTPSSESIAFGESASDSAIVTGLGGDYPAPTGNVTFYLCAVDIVPCASGGDPIGGPVDLVNGSASSGLVTPSAAGTYCFRAEYAGDDNYLGSSDGRENECFEVSAPPQVTRTQGFWSTHLDLASLYWAAIPSGDRVICSKNLGDGSNDIPELMGGFWSDISKKSDGSSRSAKDQARMQMVQQLLAAMLNVQAFGADDGGAIDDALALCSAGSSAANLTAAAAALDAFNHSGEASPLNFNPGSADPDAAQAVADKPFWNNLP